MWKKLGWTLILLCVGVAAMAASPSQLPSIFEPAPNDLSLWYLANIFGSDLISGENVPHMMLLSRLFAIFNEVVLAVGLIVLVYFLGSSILNTAAEGKLMGEKWSSVWIPIRISMGIGMLIPKAGTGYCMAQYIVMWLTIQGIGAADKLWDTMLGYFASGGAIYTQQATPVAPTAFTYDNMNYTYALQATGSIGGGSYGFPTNEALALMKNLVCMEAYNTDPARSLETHPGTYRLYTKQYNTGTNTSFLLIFGDQNHYDYKAPTSNSGSTQDLKDMQGAECGVIRIRPLGNSSTQKTAQAQNDASKINQIYGMALERMVNNLRTIPLVKEITAETPDIRWSKYFSAVNGVTQIYINDIVRYQNTLAPSQTTTSSSSISGSLNTFKEYGWILAGNYYTFLSHLNAQAAAAPKTAFILPSQANTVFDNDPHSSTNSDPTKQIDAFYAAFAGSPAAMYGAPGSEYAQDQQSASASAAGKAGGSVSSPLKNNEMQAIQNAVGATNSDQLTGETAKRVKEFLKHVSGDQKSALVSQDPILAAAKYGKELTEAAISMMVSFGTTWMALIMVSAVYSGELPFSHALAQFGDILVPLMLALGAFMYGEGAVLGTFVPVIPYLYFLTGVIGWLLHVIEAVAAASLVALGMILPETKEEIWGRAAPAFMLMLNLFLRPSLMVVGFGSAMIVTWVVVELLNIGFLTLVSGTFRIENMFGFVTIMLAYTAIFTYVVSEAYSLINVVPNQVLRWIGGDQSMSVKGAEEVIGGAKQGAEQGGRSVAGGAAFAQKADMYRAADHGSKAKKAHEAKKNSSTDVG